MPSEPWDVLERSTLHHLNRNLDRVTSEVNRLLEVRQVGESWRIGGIET